LTLYDWINSKWDMFQWSGTKKAPFGEIVRPTSLPEIDYSDPKEKKITTTIDCYVTGHYLTTKGKIFTIRQRYSITISYSNSTIVETMARIKNLLMQKFQEDNPSFDIDEVFIPPLTPEFKTVAEPRYVYRGGRIFRYMTRVQEGKFMLGIQKDIYKSRAERIIKQYGLKRQQGYIKRL